MFLKLITFMNTTRNYLDEDYSPDDVLVLDASSAHHLVKVLRKKEGDEIEIFDGRGSSCLTKILSIKSSKVTIVVTGKKSFIPREGIMIYLGQALIKPNRKVHY
jgi:16S rRNA (uracil1498-N3)-methyltransferase